jgi:16S rRNA (adenine1518-N6/adenine1519-N6)-dimethyltransferase
MNKKTLLAELEKLGMHPGRGLGQNFLLDNNLLDYIIRLADVKENETILEVGPGFGALSEKLLAANANLTAIEFDHRIAAYLRQKHSDRENFNLIEADACRVDFDQLFGAETPYRVIANLPYAISSVFIAKTAASKNAPSEMILMLQLEMAERLSASPKSKSYGALSVKMQMLYDIKIEKKVPPEVFLPPPAVDSAIVSMKRHDRYKMSKDEQKFFFSAISIVFNQRRKQMGKVLGSSYGKDTVLQCMSLCGIAPEVRPDAVSIDDFFKLIKTIYEAKKQ